MGYVMNGYGSIADVQRLLNQQGFNAGPIDNIWGPKTEAAVRAFQQARGLSVDGIVGPQTWGALKSATPAAPAAPVKYQISSSNATAQKTPSQYLQEYLNMYQKNAYKPPTNAQLQKQASARAEYEYKPQIFNVQQGLQKMLNEANIEKRDIEDYYAPIPEQLKKAYEQNVQQRWDTAGAQNRTRGGMVQKWLSNDFNTYQQQLGQTEREKASKLSAITSRSDLAKRQAQEQEQMLYSQQKAKESMLYSEMAAQAAQLGQSTLKDIFQMASAVANAQSEEARQALEEQWRQKQFEYQRQQDEWEKNFKQQQLAQQAQLERESIAAANARASANANRPTAAQYGITTLNNYYQGNLANRFASKEGYLKYLGSPDRKTAIINDIGKENYNALINWVLSGGNGRWR